MEFMNQKLEEFNQYLKQRKVAIVGLGVSNIPLLDYMYEKDANVTVFDNRSIDEIPKEIIDKITKYSMEFSFGKESLSKLVNFDIIFRSPSCLPTTPELLAEGERGAIVTSEIEMLMEMCPCRIIGVTGSEGKTTTTSLIYAILKEAGYRCFLGGNIGTPIFTQLKDMLPEDIVILELSSFQLMGMKVSPNISIITNVTPNHLNIHNSYEEYIDAKKSIFQYQDEEDVLILNYDNEITKECAKEAKGNVIFFSGKSRLENGYIVDDYIIKQCQDKLRKHILNVRDIKLRGKHNYENICAALAATQSLVDPEKAVTTISNFNSVEHRLELVRTINGVKWYNDSASSSPSRTIAGLNAYDEDIILIAGGYDKNLDYTPIAKPIVEKVKVLILVGNTAPKIFDVVKAELERQGKDIPIYVCDEFTQTIAIAHKLAKPGQVVLFSPASASFDMFKDFADRGRKYKSFVNAIEE